MLSLLDREINNKRQNSGGDEHNQDDDTEFLARLRLISLCLDQLRVTRLHVVCGMYNICLNRVNSLTLVVYHHSEVLEHCVDVDDVAFQHTNL